MLGTKLQKSHTYMSMELRETNSYTNWMVGGKAIHVGFHYKNDLSTLHSHKMSMLNFFNNIIKNLFDGRRYLDMLINIGNFIILQHFCHLIFVEFGNFSFSFFLFSGILKNNYFPPTWPLMYGTLVAFYRVEIFPNDVYKRKYLIVLSQLGLTACR